MPRELIIKAPAKVNLHLEILGRRDDGFHDLRSIFQLVSLHDVLHLRRVGVEGEIRVTGRFDFPVAENSIAQAARLFRDHTGVRDGIEFEVEKAIPAGAGFGGGSSDAAAALAGLQALFEVTVSSRALLAMASVLGSDVPFFLGSPAAVVQGRGERVTALRARSDYALVAVTPAEGISTREAYLWWDQDTGRFASRVDARSLHARRFPMGRLARMYEAWSVAEWRFRNDFDSAVFARRPMLLEARNAVMEAGALACRLTGSGSSLIGVCHDQASAEACAAEIGGSTRLGPTSASVLIPLATKPAVC